jgi:hypothetical protein
MKKTSWKKFAELIGIAAIVASLIFVGVELRQSRQIAMNEIGFVALASYFETRDTENDHAEVWTKGNLGEELDRYEMAIYRNLVRNWHSRSLWHYQFTQRLGGESSEIIVVSLAGYLHKYPNARRVWSSLREEDDLYRRMLIPGYEATGQSMEFDNRVRAVLDKLDQMDEGTPD